MLYEKELERAYQEALNVPLETIGRIVLFRADCFTAGIKAAIGPCLVAAAADRGFLKKANGLVIHGSGNTALSVKMGVDRLFSGLPVTAVVYAETSKEVVGKLVSVGIEVVAETPRSRGRASRQSLAEGLCRQRGLVLIEQHEQPLIISIQRRTLGRAIAEKINGATHFVAGVGTGSTLFGIGSAIKETNLGIRIVALEGLGSTLTLWHAYLGVKGKGYKTEKAAITTALKKYETVGMETRLRCHPRASSENWFQIDIDTPSDRVVGIEGLGVGDPSNVILEHLLEVDEVQIVTDEQAEEGRLALHQLGIEAVTSAGANFFLSSRMTEEEGSGKIVTIVTARPR